MWRQQAECHRPKRNGLNPLCKKSIKCRGGFFAKWQVSRKIQSRRAAYFGPHPATKSRNRLELHQSFLGWLLSTAPVARSSVMFGLLLNISVARSSQWINSADPLSKQHWAKRRLADRPRDMEMLTAAAAAAVTPLDYVASASSATTL